jgi:hypothetical protein
VKVLSKVLSISMWPDLADPPNHIFFQISNTGCHWEFSPTTWQSPIWPHHPLLCQPDMSVPRHPMNAMSSCHINVWTVWTATWRNPTGPRIDPEVKMVGIILRMEICIKMYKHGLILLVLNMKNV